MEAEMNNLIGKESLPFASVIIPTYHDWERLQLCLNALEAQTYPQEHFEILVVNNDPEDLPPESLVLPKNCTLLEESKPGSYAARNTGATFAKGTVLSFTDADCKPQQDWLELIAKHFDSKVGILTGYVKMFSVLNSKNLSFVECYDYIFGINNEIYAEKKAGATANLSVDRETFDKVKGFNSSLFSGGDIDFCNRVMATGGLFNYCNDLIVEHPLRNNMNDLLLKAKRLAGGKVKLNPVKGVLFAFSPPVVRLHVLFFKKVAPLTIKIKALLIVFYVKANQLSEALKVALGAKNERS